MTLPPWFKLAWLLLRRDLASGEVRVLLAALLLAVTAVTTVSFITDRAERAFALEANRLLGGDAVLRADQPIAPEFLQLAQAPGLQSTQTVGFLSMVQHAARFRLSEIKAMAPGYPLRGEIRIRTRQGEQTADSVPAETEVWLSRAGAQALGAKLGDQLKVGTETFVLSALVLQEPDAALDYFNSAPKVYLHLAALPATGLIQEGSRVTYRLVVAGLPDAVLAFERAARSKLERGQRVETISDARPEIRRALERADRFLGLAAMLAVILAAVAVAMASRRHTARHLDGCAVMRCLGAEQATIVRLYVSQLLVLGLLASALGVLLALMLQSLVSGVLAQVLGIGIPAPGWRPVATGFAVGMLVLLSFAVPPVLRLRNVPALRVLRRELAVAEPGAWLTGGVGLAGLGALMIWQSGSVQLAGIVLAGVAGALAVLAAIAWGLLALLRQVRGRLRGALRYGLANASRRTGSAIAQISALGLGLMVLLVLTLVRTDLLSRWQNELPPDAPNRFVINVQPEQVEPVQAFLNQAGVAGGALVPMIRGRLVAVNDQAVDAPSYALRGERAQRLAEREFNLSAASALPPDNTIVAGRWQSGPADEHLVSVEQGLAQALGWNLGDRLRFDIAGQPWEVEIGSLRQVRWENFRPNFFVLGSPESLRDYPASYITSFHLPESQSAQADALVERFPNLSVIDLQSVLNQIKSTADQVSRAVEYVFYFTLLAGVLVLIAAITATQDERWLEGSVMRVLGANASQLRWAQFAEFAAIGTLAGLTAALAANVISGVIAVRVFDLPWVPDLQLALIGGGVGMLAVVLTGMLATRRVLTTPPSEVLRSLQG